MTVGVTNIAGIRQRTWISVGLLVALLGLAALVMLTPYRAGVSRQHSSALHYWSAGGCPEDEGEAWSELPANLGAVARAECRREALIRTGVAAGAVLLGGFAVGAAQVWALRRPLADATA